MKNLIIFMNGQLGLDILEFLAPRHDTYISAIVLNTPTRVAPGYEQQVLETLSKYELETELFHFSQEIWQESIFLKHFESKPFGISILFGHIFPEQVIENFDKNLINLHPSLLPVGRGADPVFWSILEGNPQGATIHRVEKLVDSGEVFVQKEIEIQSWLTSGQIYNLTIDTLYKLFIEFYPNWDITTISSPQIGDGTFHKSKELSEIRERLLDAPGTLFEHLNLIQALTYNDGRKARIILPNKEIWEVSLNLQRVQR